MSVPGKTILLLGSGGREHALAWKMAQSPHVARIFVLPGSDGIARVAKVTCLAGKDALLAARENRPDLVVIGPEKPLADGVSDALEKEGFVVFGPSQAAARLESSKIFAKEFMTEFGIPTAPFKVCDDHISALAALKNWDVEGKGVVVKADGLAAGKGVVVTHDRAEAEKTVHDFMVNPACTVKTQRLLLEEKITGREVSAFALCDGRGFLTIGYACDYKRVGDGNEGPNTGGMGGFAPKDWPSDKAKKFIEENVFRRVVDGMNKRGTPFKGILFAGLMIDGDDVKVIEFNTRFGDPEAQILLPLIENDIVPLFEAAARGKLDSSRPVSLRSGAAVHVVMVSEGYPEISGSGMRLGEKIEFPETLLSSNDNALLFIAAAKHKNGGWINDGGRVLGVTAVAQDMETARARAYETIGRIHFNGAHWRKDIGR